MKKYPLYTSSGWTLLEFAVVIPVIIGAGIATYDVARVYQGKTALKATAEATLRCMVTAEGSCVVGAARSTINETTYAIQTTEEEPVVTIPLVNYQGRATLTQAPIYELTKHVRKIKSISKRPPQYYESIELLSYPNKTLVSGYVREFVKITGSSARNPNFVDSSGNSFPSTTTSFDTLIKVPKGRKTSEVKSFKVTIPAYAKVTSDSCVIFSSLRDNTPSPCGNFPWSPGTMMGRAGEQWRIANTSNRNELRDITYAVIYIEGSSTGTSLGAQGKALLSLSRPNNPWGLPTSMNLGGQFFEGPNYQANFYPRGEHSSWISDSMLKAYDGKLPYQMANYQAIAVHPGETITLHLSVTREDRNNDSASLQWKFGAVKLFLPQYTPVQLLVDCKTQSVCDTICHLSAYGLPDTTLTPLSRSISKGSCSSTLLPNTTGISGAHCKISTYSEDNHEHCPSKLSVSEINCGDNIYVKSGEEPLTTAVQECSIAESENITAVTTEPTTFTKTIIAEMCSDLPVQEPPEWALIDGTFRSTLKGYTSVPYHVSHCEGFKESVMTFEDCKPNVQKNIMGLFSISQRQEDPIPLDRLKNEAIQCGMNPLAHFEATFSFTGKSETLTAEAPILSPTGTIVAYPSFKTNTIELGTYPVGELPEICKTKPCTRTEKSNNSDSTVGTSVDLSKAMSVAKSTLRTYFPNALIEKDCGGKVDCFEISINSAVEPLSISINGRTSVMTPGIKGNSFPVTYEQHQYSERTP